MSRITLLAPGGLRMRVEREPRKGAEEGRRGREERKRGEEERRGREERKGGEEGSRVGDGREMER